MALDGLISVRALLDIGSILYELQIDMLHAPIGPHLTPEKYLRMCSIRVGFCCSWGFDLSPPLSFVIFSLIFVMILGQTCLHESILSLY